MNTRSSESIRILQLPYDYAGQASLLRDEFITQGHHSELWTFSSHPYYRKPDRVIFPNATNRIQKFVSLLSAASYVFGKWDVVLYNGGSSLFSPRMLVPDTQPSASVLRVIANIVMGTLQRLELLLLRSRGVKLFMIYQGDDLRQGDRSLDLFHVSAASEVATDYYSKTSDKHKRRQANLFSKFTEKIYLVNPDLFNFYQGPASFLPSISRQEIISPTTLITGPKRTRVLKVLHAPSHRDGKGTKYVIAAIDSLRERGFDVELQLVEGMTNSDALRAYSEADLVIDQLLSGWYGVLAVECMSMGKPVMAFIRECDLEFIPKAMERDLPIIRTSKGTLEADLESVINLGQVALHEVGLASSKFVEEWHNPTSVALKLVDDFLDDRGVNLH